MRHPVALALLVASVLSGRAEAELTPRLVRDIDTTPYSGSSHPRGFISAAHGFAFTAFGRELWEWDERNEILGSVLGGRSLRAVGDRLFAVEEDRGKSSVWIFTCCLSVSVPVRLSPPVFRQIDGAWSLASGIVVAGDAGAGRRLLAIDVERQEVDELAHLAPLADGSLLGTPTRFRGALYFVGRRAGGAPSFFVTDGTRAGTRTIPTPGSVEAIAGALTVRGREVLLLVAAEGAELWTSDGTARGTRPLAELGPGSAAARLVGSVQVVGRVFLAFDEGARGRTVWVTDGTARGTRRVARFAPKAAFGPVGFSARPLGAGLLFFADDGASGREPYWSGGTAAATRRLGDLCPGPCGSEGEALAGRELPLRSALFSARTAGAGRELWRTDGTVSGTRLVGETCPGECDGDPQGAGIGFGPGGGTVISWTGKVGSGERALFRVDGRGMARLTPPGVEVRGGDPTAADWNYSAFAAADPVSGEELWRSDGTPEGTRLWQDLEQAQELGSEPRALGIASAAGERLLFSAFDPAHRRQLWASDGTAAGTVRIPGFPLGEIGWTEVRSASAGGLVYLAAKPRDGASTALYASDGTAAGTRRLTPPDVEVVGYPGLFAAARGVMFFARDPDHGQEIWASDGTLAGTRVAVDLTPGAASTEVSPYFGFVVPGVGALAGRVLFVRPDDGDRLWVSDGTPAGTGRLADLFPAFAPIDGLLDGRGPRLVATADRTFFVGRASDASGSRVFATDGTTAGTHDLGLPAAGEVVTRLLASGSRAFVEIVVPGGRRYWATDGIPGDARPATASLDDFDLRPAWTFDGRLLFEDDRGELAVSEGDEATVARLDDADGAPVFAFDVVAAMPFAGRLIVSRLERPCAAWSGAGALAPIPGPTCRALLGATPDLLFFEGIDARTGAELWRLEERSSQTSSDRVSR